MLRTLSPLKFIHIAINEFPSDLHVLSTPPAFVLSQNQTLRKKALPRPVFRPAVAKRLRRAVLLIAASVASKGPGDGLLGVARFRLRGAGFLRFVDESHHSIFAPLRFSTKGVRFQRTPVPACSIGTSFFWDAQRSM